MLFCVVGGRFSFTVFHFCVHWVTLCSSSTVRPEPNIPNSSENLRVSMHHVLVKRTQTFIPRPETSGQETRYNVM
jgi:hypothetical protein